MYVRGNMTLKFYSVEQNHGMFSSCITSLTVFTYFELAIWDTVVAVIFSYMLVNDNDLNQYS